MTRYPYTTLANRIANTEDPLWGRSSTFRRTGREIRYTQTIRKRRLFILSSGWLVKPVPNFDFSMTLRSRFLSANYLAERTYSKVLLRGIASHYIRNNNMRRIWERPSGVRTNTPVTRAMTTSAASKWRDRDGKRYRFELSAKFTGAFYYLPVVAFPFPFHGVILDTKSFVCKSLPRLLARRASRYTMAARNCSISRTLENGVSL